MEDDKFLIYCESDYFKKQDLICCNCQKAIRGPHINAIGKKFHIEHFTCSVCAKQFRQHDSYFEKDGNVYCGEHYSVLFAAKCHGCNTAVLKNFVETEANSEPLQWHPYCYMIFKLWQVKVYSPESKITYTDVDQKVSQILQVVSGFEESAAECISEMLVFFSNDMLPQGVLYASKFLQHIETLFHSLDDIQKSLISYGDIQPNYKEPKQLVKKIIHFFSLLSGNQDHESRLSSTKEMISLVTSLAHTLKIIIRNALNGAFRLEQVYQREKAISNLLDSFDVLKSQDSTNRYIARLSLVQTNSNASSSPSEAPQLKQFLMLN